MLALLLALQTTNCQWTPNGWTCEQSKPVDQGSLLQSGRNMVSEYRAEPEDRAENLRKAVGNLIARDKCDEAIRLALKAGNLELADQAKAYCSRK